MKRNPNGYESLTQIIDQMTADTLDRNTIQSLRSMLDLPAFQPIRAVIEKKIIEVGNFLKTKEIPAQEFIEVYMGNAPNVTSVQVEKNDAEEAGLRKEVEDLLKRIEDLPDYEYENENAVRGDYSKIHDKVENQLEFDVLLPTIDTKPKDPV